MICFLEFGADKFVFHQTAISPPIMWILNDSMYVRFGGVRNTKTWSKSNHRPDVVTNVANV